MEIENMSLSEIIETNSLRTFLDSFSAATGMSVAALDKDEMISGSTYWSGESDFCANCVKNSSEGADRCKKFTQGCINEAKNSLRTIVKVCHAGLSEFAIPVIVRGSCIGVLVGGQAFTNKPDSRKMNSTARTLGINPTEYEAAANEVETVSETRIQAAADLLSQMVSDMAENGYMRALAAERGNAAREGNNENGEVSEIGQKINSVVDSVNNITHDCERIKDAVSASTKAVDNTDIIVKTIENASTQLTLIGFNASIEAKRAGAAGAGFNVIAQEVRTLAEKNSKQTAEIQKTLDGIKKSMSDINNQIKMLYGGIENISDLMNDLSLAESKSEQTSSNAD
ncbi:MAG: PocR ligand-binding domain-containing protein [Oscillospiraceae bacterium]|nr:PocR ligand-binding domain-containing protein [Oscillospiraceae bacterium]